MATNVENIQVTTRSNAAQGVIAIAIVFAFFYLASSVVIAVFLSALIAYFLDPFVKVLERIHIPRALGALLTLLIAASALVAVGYLIVESAQDFTYDWPRYSLVLRHVIASADRKLAGMEKQVSQIAPEEPRGRVTVRVEEPQTVRSVVTRSISSLGSVYSALLVWTFLPFLIFFMLAAKPKIWDATLGLFPPGERSSARDALDQVSIMLRSYVAGSGLVVVILILASWALFSLMGLQFAFLTAVVSGICNIIPYIGAVLSWAPPVFIGLGQWTSVGPFIGIIGGLMALHLIAMNVLMPAFVGRRVHLNALAVTVALLFWGWLWGAMGLILAIPITAVAKVICDHVPSWQPIGRWLGS